MCPSHWTRVPNWLQCKIHRTRKRAMTGDHAGALDYVAAKAEALRAVSPRGQCRSDLRALEAAV